MAFNRTDRLVNELHGLTGQPDRATDRAREAIKLAVIAAYEFGSAAVDSRHLLCGLIRQGEGIAFQVIACFGVDIKGLEQALQEATKGDEVSLPCIEDDLSTVLKNCGELAVSMSHHYIGTEHLLLALVAEKTNASIVLKQLGVNCQDVSLQLRKLLGGQGVGLDDEKKLEKNSTDSLSKVTSSVFKSMFGMGVILFVSGRSFRLCPGKRRYGTL